MSPITAVLTLKSYCVYINTAFLKDAPGMMYALFMVDRGARKLVLCQCDHRERDAVRLRSANEITVRPRLISAREFCDRVFRLMQWNDGCVYKVTGTLMHEVDKSFVAFSLQDAFVIGITQREDNKEASSE